MVVFFSPRITFKDESACFAQMKPLCVCVLAMYCFGAGSWFGDRLEGREQIGLKQFERAFLNKTSEAIFGSNQQTREV